MVFENGLAVFDENHTIMFDRLMKENMDFTVFEFPATVKRCYLKHLHLLSFPIVLAVINTAVISK